jgi:hypothetical protein
VKFRDGEVVAILEIAALPALFPRALVDIELAIFLARSRRVDADLENLSGYRFAELELFKIWINGAETSFHTFLCSDYALNVCKKNCFSSMLPEG